MPTITAYPDEVTAVVSENEVVIVEIEGTGPQGPAGAGGGIASETHAAASKTTPVDADELPLVDSVSTPTEWSLKKLTFANLKATLKTYMDTLYALTGHNHTGTYDPAGTAATVAGNLATHEGLTATAHGGIVASNDSRLSDSRTPTIHNNTKHSEAYIVQAAAVAPNSAITGATKTKITYDAKGLVTGGADATASDVGALPIGGGVLTGVTTAYPDTTTKHGGIRNIFLSTEAATAGSNIDLMADGDLWIQHAA